MAVLSSIEHIRGELRVASTLTSTLLDAVEKAQANRSDVSRHCSTPRTLCAQATAMIWGGGVLHGVIQDLSMLEGIFDLALDGTSHIHGPPDSFLFTLHAMRENADTLAALLISVQKARQTAALALNVGRDTA